VPFPRLSRSRRDPHALLPVDLLVNFTLRDLRSKYKRSALGWTWSVVDVVVYSAIFSVFLRVEPSIGDPGGGDHQNGLVTLGGTWSALSVDARPTGPRSDGPRSDGS
jgi:hypothetical protein